MTSTGEGGTEQLSGKVKKKVASLQAYQTAPRGLKL